MGTPRWGAARAWRRRSRTYGSSSRISRRERPHDLGGGGVPGRVSGVGRRNPRHAGFGLPGTPAVLGVLGRVRAPARCCARAVVRGRGVRGPAVPPAVLDGIVLLRGPVGVRPPIRAGPPRPPCAGG